MIAVHRPEGLVVLQYSISFIEVSKLVTMTTNSISRCVLNELSRPWIATCMYGSSEYIVSLATATLTATSSTLSEEPSTIE